MLAKSFRVRRTRVVAIVFAFLLLAISAPIVSLVLAIIRATHSDVDIRDVVKKLLPAGNCMCESSTVFDCGLSLVEAGTKKVASDEDFQGLPQWQFQYSRDSLNFGMSREQCDAAFPGYFEEVLRAVEIRNKRHTKVTADDLDAIELSEAMVRAMIVDGKLRILESKHVHPDYRKKGLAILHSIHRSISKDGRQIPNVEFIFSVQDMANHPTQPIWTLSRRAQDHDLWLMPDFGFWSWDLQDLGTLDDVIEEVTRYESSTEWATKIPKLVWRGKLQSLPKLRRALLDASQGKPWSDVAGSVPGPSLVAENYISALDQCKYMFIAHAEGRSYSGSLKYRQVCRSVVVMHKLQWIQHYHYVFVANGTNQNFVEVERDFSDLEEKMEFLISHPEEAKRIADNSIKTFREHYFAPAAEACYWRALIRGWAQSSFEPQVYERKPGDSLGRARGMRFENFALLNTDTQMNYKWA